MQFPYKSRDHANGNSDPIQDTRYKNLTCMYIHRMQVPQSLPSH